MSQREIAIAGIFGALVLVGVVVFSLGDRAGIRPIASVSRFMAQLISVTKNIPACSDGIDNDNDGAIDYPADFSCSSPKDDNEQQPWPECFDGLDNDDDGLTDLDDTGCFDLQDNKESDSECSDHQDNDGDGLIDFPNDPGCRSLIDDNEFNSVTLQTTRLIPGTGFTGPTPTPVALGDANQEGFDAVAIAHWDMVPYQTVDAGETLNVGVLAYHFNNIAYVDFSVDGGPWTRVDRERLNPASDAVEFWTTLRASDFPTDGQVEIRAIAYPNIGQPRVLQGGTVSNHDSSLFISVNGQGTLPHEIRYVKTTGNDANTCRSASQACATIARAVASAKTGINSLDGAEIRLGAGEWLLPELPGGMNGSPGWWVPSYSTQTRWFTITSIPGVSRDDVFVTGMAGGASSPGLWLKQVHVKDVSIVGNLDKAPGQGVMKYLWIDDSKMFYRDPDIIRRSACGPFQGNGVWTGLFMTDLYMDNTCDGPSGATLVRNVFSDRSGSGHASGAPTVVNYSVKTIYGSGYPFPLGPGPDYHSDIYQFYTRTSDAILYGLKTIPGGFIYSRGIAGANNNTAIVNTDIDTRPVGWVFSTCGPINHLVIKNSTFRGTSSPWCGENPNPTTFGVGYLHNVLMDHAVFDNDTIGSRMHPDDLSGIRFTPSITPAD